MRPPNRLHAELWVSRGVREKLHTKHRLEVWEIEQAIFDDPDRFAVRAGDLYAMYGRTFAGRYILSLVRQLPQGEVAGQVRDLRVAILRLVTARDMNATQRRQYQHRRGG